MTRPTEAAISGIDRWRSFSIRSAPTRPRGSRCQRPGPNSTVPNRLIHGHSAPFLRQSFTRRLQAAGGRAQDSTLKPPVASGELPAGRLEVQGCGWGVQAGSRELRDGAVKPPAVGPQSRGGGVKVPDGSRAVPACGRRYPGGRRKTAGQGRITHFLTQDYTCRQPIDILPNGC